MANARPSIRTGPVGSWPARLLTGAERALGRREPRTKVGVLAILKDEGRNLREWVDHYRWQGVEKFFLIDNGSTDGSRDLVAGEIAAGIVEWHVRTARHAQVRHYRDVFRRAGIRRKVEWLVMADLDEFWYAPRSSLKEEVDRLEGVDLMYANWRVFGTSGHQAHPPSLRRGLTMRSPDLAPHSVTKFICRTDAIWTGWQFRIHKLKGVPSVRVVSDNERFHLNHYVTQSMEYFTKVKMVRGDADKRRSDHFRDMEYFRAIEVASTFEDRVLADRCAGDAASRADPR